MPFIDEVKLNVSGNITDYDVHDSAARDAVAEEYDTSAHGYSVGDLVFYNDSVYKCVSDVAQNDAWTAANWTLTSVKSELKSREDDIASLNGSLKRMAWASEECAFTDNAYITTNIAVGSTVDVENPTSSSVNSYAVVACRKGDKFILGGYGGNASRFWCFTDTEYKLLSKSNNSASATELELTASADGYLIAHSTKTNANRKLIHYYYLEDIQEKLGELTPKQETVHCELANNTVGSGNKFLISDGTPSADTSDNWKVYIYDVDGIDGVKLSLNLTYNETTPYGVSVWSLTTLPFADWAVADVLSSTIVETGNRYRDYSGVKELYIDIPSTAKTLMVSCRTEDTPSYPVVYFYKYNQFTQLKNITTDYRALSKSFTQLVDRQETIHCELVNNTVGSDARFIKGDGTPSADTPSAWKVYIYDVDGVDGVKLSLNLTYNETTPNGVSVWSLTTLPFADWAVADVLSSTIVETGNRYRDYSGVTELYIDIPSTAKTLMVSCRTEDTPSYPVVYFYKYNQFTQLKKVLGKYNELSTTVNGITYQTSPFFRSNLRWGAPAFGEYYHSEDDNTALFTSSTTAAEYYSALNTLVADYSSYVTATDLGVSSDETTHIYSYMFNPLTNEDDANYKRPKLIIISGQHGFEKVAPFGIYWFIKDLLENWTDNSFLAYVRNHVQLVIIPVMNPYGFDHDGYLNANGTNLNRNWGTTGWEEEGSGTSYTGPSAFSEVETQYGRDVVLANTDALFVIDFHNPGKVAPDTAAGYIWHSASKTVHNDEYFEKSYSAAKWHVEEMSGHFYIDYPGYCSYAVSGNITDTTPISDGYAKNYAIEHGIMAQTIEGASAFIGNGDRFTPAVQHMNADILGNYLRVLLATYWHD